MFCRVGESEGRNDFRSEVWCKLYRNRDLVYMNRTAILIGYYGIAIIPFEDIIAWSEDICEPKVFEVKAFTDFKEALEKVTYLESPVIEPAKEPAPKYQSKLHKYDKRRNFGSKNQWNRIRSRCFKK